MQATGVQIDGPFLRRAHVRRLRQNLHIVSLSSDPCEDLPEIEAPLVSGLNSNDLIIRSRTFTPAKSRKLRQALILQIEAQLHLKAEDVLTVSVFDDHEKRATTYSTTRAALNDHLQSFHPLRIDPERVSAIPAALQAFVKWKDPELSSYFLLDIGLATTNCIWVENGALQKAHALHSGQQTLKDLCPPFAEEAKAFRREILKFLHSFQCQRPLILTLESDLDGLREFLLEGLRECIAEEKKLTATDEEQRYAIPIGLAIDYLENTKYPIQFRTGTSISRQHWQKLGLRSGCLIVAAVSLCALLYETGACWIDKREREIVHNLETWTAAKDPKLRLELFSGGCDTADLVDRWLNLIEKNAKDYRYLMRAPKVAEFLTWLTHHPLVESFQISSDPIVFEQIRYQLVSFPHLEAASDPYLVKVELDFKVASPLHARKFHEMLLQGSGLVDPSHEIGWEVLPDRYRAAFYLKNEL